MNTLAHAWSVYVEVMDRGFARSQFQCAITVLLVVAMAAGCSSKYVPTTEEAIARGQLVSELHSVLSSMPHPADAVVAHVPGLSEDDIRVFGNYRGMQALLLTKYYTDESPEVACPRYLAFVKTLPHLRDSQIAGSGPVAACELRQQTDYASAGFWFVDDFPVGNPQRFELSVSIIGHNLNPRANLQDGKHWKSTINILARRAMNKTLERLCLPVEMTGKEQCPEAIWNEPSNKGSDKRSSVSPSLPIGRQR
jgi:hypothetical protein